MLYTKEMSETQETVAQQPQQSVDAAASSINNSLYVGELDQSVSEAILYELFSTVGPVTSIRVCRDSATRVSLGYAYVNYRNPEDCNRAIELLNFTEIKNRPCRIMFSQRDPTARRSGSGNIFIKNLDPSIDSKALHDTFAAFGTIISCKIEMDGGVSKGYGFVHYESPEAAQAAIKAVNGMLLNDKQVFVGPHIARKDRKSKQEEIQAQFTNLYIKNIPESMTEDQLTELFNKYGKTQSVAIQRDEEGKSKKFGFVNYEDHEEAAAAVAGLNETEIDGQKLYVGRAQKRSERDAELRRQYEQNKAEKSSKTQAVNLYIKNLDDSIDDAQLAEKFAQYGVITSAKVMTDDKGKSKGFGFVCFTTPSEATKAIAETNGIAFGAKPIYVALAQNKELRRRQLEAQAAQRQQMRMQQMMANPATAAAGMIPPGAAPMYMGAPGYYPGGFAPAGPQQMQPRPGMAPMYPQQMMQQRPMRWNGAPQPGGFAPQGGQGGYQQGGYTPRPRPPRNQNPGRIDYKFINPNPRQQGGPRPPKGSQQQQQQQPKQMPQAVVPAAVPAPEPTPAEVEAAIQNLSLAPAAAQLFDASTLDGQSPEDQKQVLGEALYPLIEDIDAEQAGKITGMFLEMDNADIINLINTPDALKSKIAEAQSVLQTAQ
ncbi:polyadenylate binding protein [Ramicandelaber brevisporus]|nr:polyadenylate binding protein [Ramicandelaber brevisporus]